MTHNNRRKPIATCYPSHSDDLKNVLISISLHNQYTKDKNKHTILILLYDWILNSFSYYSTQVFKLICLLSRTPPELIELLISLEEKAAESYPPDTMASLSEDETELKLNSFFPSLPIQRCRGTYEMDLKGCRKSSHDCNKKSRGHPSLLPGVFCLFCEHGI